MGARYMVADELVETLVTTRSDADNRGGATRNLNRYHRCYAHSDGSLGVVKLEI
jgi:hypothetical protein